MKNSYRFFRNVDCKYFPCHETGDTQNFNCLFCYCPLYFLGERCGGNFKYVGKDASVKSCENCTLPHDPDYYEQVIDRLKNAPK